jgi:GT2 family glycosyltransferase
LEALSKCKLENNYKLITYLVDDGSTDGTALYLNGKFKNLNIIPGSGELFWAGGMRKAWDFALKDNINPDYYLLLNDDTVLFEDTIVRLLEDLKSLNNNRNIIVGSTMDPDTRKTSYGGHIISNKLFFKSKMLIPNGKYPQRCDLGNANIMLVSREVHDELGNLSQAYTHGIADYDYTLRGLIFGIKTYISRVYGGYCKNDHGVNWVSQKRSFKERIAYLYSPKGLSYREYMYFIKSHLPYHLPQAFLFIWLKTMFPILWDKFKDDEYLK